MPTTAGTGSEVGRAGVVVNEETHQKKIIFHPKMMPGVVISDPELTVGLPPAITAATGSMPSCIASRRTARPASTRWRTASRSRACASSRSTCRAPASNGTDIEARSRMLAAASMGATAFQKGLGGVHAIAHPVGAYFNTHHGLTNAVLLPYVMVHNRAAIEARVAIVARVLDLKGEPFGAVFDWVLGFRKRLKHPAHPRRHRRAAATAADTIGREAALDPSAGGNPQPADAAAYARIFRSAVKGDMGLAV